MAKIDFGYNNDTRLNAQFEGYDTTGEYIYVVNYNGDNYLISNIQGQYNVKEVFQDIYPDGSYSTYANSAISEICLSMERALNKVYSRNQIANELSAYEVLKTAGFEVTPSNLRPIITEYGYVPGIVTSIRTELFEDLKNAYRYQHNSIYGLCKQIEMLQMQLDELQNEKGKSI